MARTTLDFHDISFVYDSATARVFTGLDLRVHSGWTAVVGPNGAGKTTLLRLAAGELTPTSGRIHSPGRAVYCAQRTDDPPEDLEAFLIAGDRPACSLRGRLAVADDALARWPSLSHGERKRAQIAVALWRRPAALFLDEPTNHIDHGGRRLLTGALRSFRGVGLLVSHDRELMEAICDHTLFVESPGAELRPGAYGAASAERAREAEEAGRALAKGRRELARLEAESADRKRRAEQVARKLSKRGISAKDHSAKARIDAARVTGVDANAMRRAHQLDGRRRQVEEKLVGLESNKPRRLGITQSGSRSRRDALVDRPAGRIPLPDGRAVAHPRLRIEPEDRIGVTGPNGSGKTTLLRHLLDGLDLPEGRLLSLPQELTAEDGARIADAVRSLPRERRGEVITVVSRLGSDPERVLETARPSPGELRKILLALGLTGEPWLIAMDEPTNHLDLPSVECLEAALAEFPGALLLVSHDHEFLARTVTARWDLARTPEGATLSVSDGF